MKRVVKVQADGQLKVNVNNKLFSTSNGTRSWYVHQCFAWVLLFVLAIIDVSGFLQIAEATISENGAMRTVIVSGFAASFELAPLYVGYTIALKAYNINRDTIQKTAFWLSLSAFILGVVLNGVYRYMTMDIAYARTTPLGEAEVTDAVALPLTILMSGMPLITSLVNLVVGLLSYDPLLFNIKKIERRIAVLKEKKRQIDGAISELKDDSMGKSYLSDAKSQYDYAVFELVSAQTRLKQFIRSYTNVTTKE